MSGEAAGKVVRRMLMEAKAAYKEREAKISAQHGEKWSDWPQEEREELCLLMGRAEALEEALVSIE